jgi:hypothetical protein
MTISVFCSSHDWIWTCMAYSSTAAVSFLWILILSEETVLKPQVQNVSYSNCYKKTDMDRYENLCRLQHLILKHSSEIQINMSVYKGCFWGECAILWKMFVRLIYIDVTKNAYLRIRTLMKIMAREKCGILAVPRTVPVNMCHPYTAQVCPWADSQAKLCGDECGVLCKVLEHLRSVFMKLVWA